MNDMSRQFTPAQILDAARRAESDGRTDYALKFYGHLVEQFPNSPEGVAASEALARLSPPAFGDGRYPSGAPAQANTAGYAQGQAHGYNHGQGVGQFSAAGAAAHNGGPNLSSVAAGVDFRGGYEEEHRGRRRGGHSDPRRHAQGEDDLAVMGAGRGYLIGRALALFVVWSGVLVALIGCGVVGSILFNVTVLLDVLGLVPGFKGLSSGALAVAGGIGLIFVGQLAQAVFEIANAARDISWLSRYQAERNLRRRRRGQG